MSRFSALLVLACWLLPAAAIADQDRNAAFQAARKLQQEGKEHEAFLAYAGIPGAQHAAVQLARPKAAEFLAVLQEKGKAIPAPLSKLVEGDLLLALRKKEQALACYRAVAAAVANSLQQGWATGHVPMHAYLVEPPSGPEARHFGSYPLEPFTVGPGSHRDNWLLRRFIALESWDDAAAEFARVWQIHRGRSRPYLVEVPVRTEGKEVIREKRLVRPAGFDGQGLLFALDYAFFLKRRGGQEEALAMLREPLLEIDMDRNPNTVRPEAIPEGQDMSKLPVRRQPQRLRFFFGTSAGVSRKEFLRLAYGVFKAAGKEEALVAVLKKQIDAGDNRARRPLARVRLHQGRIDDALALELEYIDKAAMDPLSAAYRRGLAHEEARQLEQAAAAYETALKLPYQPKLAMPDKDEETVQGQAMRQMVPFTPDPATPAGRAAFQADLLGRLQRIYGALGKADKVFDTTLRQFEANPALLANFNALEQARTRAEVLGREEEFRKQLAAAAVRTTRPESKANVHWILKDYAACARVLAESQTRDAEGRAVQSFSFDQWRDRFRRAGGQHLRTFLVTLIEADPKNTRARLELLDLEDRFQGPEVIAALEALLESNAGFAFVRGKGVYNRTRFRGYFDLAYRLLRLYEKAGQLEKLRGLGLRIADGQKPFGPWWKTDPSQHQFRNENGEPECLNACLTLLVQRADEATIDKLQELWKQRDDFPAKRQLARRWAGGLLLEEPGADVGWANLPDGVRLIVSHENVLSLACDDQYLYAGHPWGVAVYDLEGKPVTRIALGEAARALAAGNGILWAGTPKGLFRIERKTWKTAHLWLHGDVPERNRHARSFGGHGDYWFDNAVYTLALDARWLWIGLHRNVQRLDLEKMAIRAYSYRELKTGNWAGFDRFLPDGEYVWAVGDSGLRRYDRASDTWQAVEAGQRGVGLIGLIDGRLFGHVWLNNELRDRPCLIDRNTLAVTPILIDGDLSQSARCINGPFSFYGTYRGQLVFGPGHPAFVLDEATLKLRPIGAPWDRPEDPIRSILPGEMQSGPLFYGAAVGRDQPKPPGRKPLLVRQMDSDAWSLLRYADGRMIVGRRNNRIRYQYPQEDWPFRDIVWDSKQDEGGLWLVSADGKRRRISAVPHADTLRGNAVFDAVPNDDRDQLWLCTDLGLAVLDDRDRVVAGLTRADGLCANRTVGGLALGGRLYFAAGWGDHGGALTVFDPRDHVLAAFYQSDGLATDKLAAIQAADGKIRLIYDVEYGRGGPYSYRIFPPGVFDPDTATVQSGGGPKYPKQNDANKMIAARAGKPDRPMPYLGGCVIAQRRIGPKTYLCGTRGLAVFEGDSRPEPAVEQLAAEVTTDPYVKLKAAADRVQTHIRSAEDFARYAEDENPFIRQRALSSGQHLVAQNPAPLVPALKRLTRDPHGPNRRMAARLLGMAGDQSAVPLLQAMLEDSECGVRDQAALAMARLGKRPDLAVMEPILAAAYGKHGDAEEVYGALVPGADRAAFALFLKYPLHADDYEARQAIFKQLAAALLADPKLADLLLSAYDPADDPGPESNYGRSRFAQEVFRHAGAKILARLHKALASDDRVVRSNAARACGSIGDLSSIPHLLKALDLESGLSRGSIVWALGQLKAEQALPQLATLYVDARNDEKRRRGAGFRAAQAQAQTRSQFESISNLATVAADWDELKAAAQPARVDPRRNERLLDPEMILKAVRNIGPESSQEFYRKLAAERDRGARHEAAERLAEGRPEDAEKNIPILRNLVADEDRGVRAAAAVSLLLLGRNEVQKQILAVLRSPDRWEPQAMVVQLDRVRDGRLLVFARAEIEKIAREAPRHSRAADVAPQLLERMAKE